MAHQRLRFLSRVTWTVLLFLTILAGSSSVLAQLPDSWDWRDVGGGFLVMPPKSVGACGAAYILIPVAMVESRRMVAWYNIGGSPRPVDYSEQYLLACASGYFGEFDCGGGYAKDSLTWIRDTGIPVDACYTYRGADSTCPDACPDSGQPLNLIRMVTEVYENSAFMDEQSFMEQLWQNGPMAVRFDVYEDFYAYDEGIYQHTSGDFVGGWNLLVVGWGSEGGVDYWICQNCWGENWGEDGYVRIARTPDYAGCQFGEWTWWCSVDVPVTPVPESEAGDVILAQNHPNPFNPQTTIAFILPEESTVELVVYDVSGRRVRELLGGEICAKGRNEIPWSGCDAFGRLMPSGTYFYRLQAGEYVETKRMTLLK